ncbi:transfer protein spdA [Streptomyces sp. CdTB01]|uniref:transfer protein spdA n=1 Tax=Streptomyces sp. CdTB01 TaxID=1725411 RepID=UPI001EEFDCB2|nr:transfer protein spdA [Streptomyces sp. CdTB01]
MIISFATQRDLALTHGVTGWPAYAVPLAIDLYLIWAVRSGRDVALAVAVSMSANVAGVLSVEPLSAVSTWVGAALHAVFPLTIWRMERPSSQFNALEVSPAVAKSDAPPAVSAWPSDDLWQDFADTAPDSEPDAMATPPSAPDIRAAVAVLASRHGRPVTGRMLADHFSVSERTGRRYLALAGDPA